MGTTYAVVLGVPLTHDKREALAAEVAALLADINAAMSTYDPESELSRFNRHASTEPLSISRPLAEVVRMAQGVSHASGGAFDVTVGPLVDAWGFGPRGRREQPLQDSELDALRERVGYANFSSRASSCVKPTRSCRSIYPRSPRAMP